MPTSIARLLRNFELFREEHWGGGDPLMQELAREGQHPEVLVIANAENSAGGFGITRETGEELLAAGVDLMTSGNHVWDKKEALDYIPLEPRLGDDRRLRPGDLVARRPTRPGAAGLVRRNADGAVVALTDPGSERRVVRPAVAGDDTRLALQHVPLEPPGDRVVGAVARLLARRRRREPRRVEDRRRAVDDGR